VFGEEVLVLMGRKRRTVAMNIDKELTRKVHPVTEDHISDHCNGPEA
jgi:hypothetical protein